MASNSVQQQQQQQQQQFPPQAQMQQSQQQQQLSSPHHCKECGLHMNSAESLEVHLEYHKENLLNKWASQAAASSSEETNNNTPKNAVKREFINSAQTAADSSDSLKKSPEYGNRATPEAYIIGHPPTPQSYHSASSPYQNADNATFSPSFQNYPVKSERSSPAATFQQQQQQQQQQHQQSYPNFSESQFFNLEAPPSQAYPSYPQEHAAHKMGAQNSFRYHPYQMHAPTASSSPAYPPQPTPSPSPKQCDKCGYVCESASQLIEHLNVAHPPTPAPHLAPYQSQFMFASQDIKTEDDTQSEILDLDSHKVHQVYPEDDKRQQLIEMNGHNPHSVSAMLSWPQQQQKMMMYDQKLFQIPPEQQKMLYQQQQQQHQLVPDYMNGGVGQQQQQQQQQLDVVGGLGQQTYRGFEHVAPQQAAAPVITSTQVPSAPSPAASQSSTKSSNWKSNEARRPKTYNCTACNKWFTSSGHLKRHYNTTLHKNAVKSSGQPDPATMPISAHHHPARDPPNNSKEDRNSSSPHDDSRGGGDDNSLLGQTFERVGPMPGMLQQAPNGPYDRAPNIHHPPMHSPMGPSPSTSLSNLSAGSPPNGEAGLSATNLDSRGLLSINSSPTPPNHTSNSTNTGFSMMPMDNNQFPMYPNASAPHVTQATATTNSLNTTGEYHHQQQFGSPEDGESQQPLPSFAQFTAHRYGMMLGPVAANVGGTGPATAPYTYYTETYDMPEARALIFRQEDDDYKLTVMTAAQPALEADPYTPQTLLGDDVCEPSTSNRLLLSSSSPLLDQQPASPEKAHLQRDLLEENGSAQISSTVAAKQAIVHKCFDCDKVFNKSCYLTQHNKTFHEGDRPFKCSRCGKRFPTERIIEEHEKKHGGEKPHKCEICPKQFNHKTDLRRHMCLHTGNKPYSCSTCGKGFIRKDHMLKHCETHLRRPKLPSARSG